MDGSGNYEARRFQGWVEGDGRYADTEPHHARAEGGAWNYVTMHSPARERLLSLIIDGEFDGESASGKLTAHVHIVERFPAKSDSAEDDYGETAARTWLCRENGSVTEEIEIHPGTDYEMYSDGWDLIERDGDEWVATYYRATLEREVAKH